MEVKEDFMTSPAGDSKPIFRTAHFLKPISNSIRHHHQPTCLVFEPNERSLKINFNDWIYPHTKWVRWVDQLKPKYESVWKKVGIFEAIMATKCHIKKDQNLLYGVVEKWCSETNTFVFPFGEATITLEDVIVLGGYPILGNPVFTSLENEEMREVEKKLIIAAHERTSMWMDTFIGRESEIEHEAFLATWLSICVFPHKHYVLKSSLFPIAICLARGYPIALAPAVLGSLYKDLTMFKKTILDLQKCSDKFPLVLDINLQSPFYLVQVWIWERFKNLQPQPNLINNGDQVLLKWHNVKPLKIENVRFELDSAIDDFIWRPYVRYADKCRVFYPNDEIVVPFKKELMVEQMLSFVICLRVSELVGFESIEQYLPHRVSMQFGLDQDVPGYVSRFNATKDIAWKNYSRPFSDSNKSLRFPSRFFEADITTRYANWWKKLVSYTPGFVKNVVPIPKLVSCTITIGKCCGDGSKTSKGYNIDGGASSSLPPKENTLTPLISFDDCDHVSEEGNESNEARIASDRNLESGAQTDNSLEDGLNAERNIDVDAPSSLPPSDCQSELKLKTTAI